MKYFLIISLIILFIILLILYHKRKKWAIKKVKWETDEEKLCSINAILNPFGFTFLLEKDIIISQNDGWQREFGYREIYDYKAPFFGIVMDSFPLCFKYNNKNYRIEFWKGQYGLATGAEVGVYIEERKGVYRAATDKERLDMSFILSKKCRLFSRHSISWWLTGFDVGNFSKPKNLKLNMCIKFKDEEMQKAFIKALKQAGYTDELIEVCDNVVCFTYCKPPFYKPNCTYRLIKLIAQCFNFINCRIYKCFTRHFERTIDRLSYLRYMAPCLYHFVLKISVPKRKKKCYHKR